MKYFFYIFFSLVIVTTVSCDDILLEEDISDSGIELLAPGHNASIKTNVVSFHWTEVEGATSYKIQIAVPDFENPQQIIINTEVDEIFFTTELPVNEYEWRIKALNSGFQTKFFVGSFTVESEDNFSSNQVLLLSPPIEHITNDDNLSLEWSDVEDAVLYRVQVLKDGIVVKEEVTTNSYLNVSLSNGGFLWRVRAEKETENTFYSNRTLFIDTVQPNVPKLTKPENAANLSEEDVIFKWERTEINGSVEIDSIYIFKDEGTEVLLEKDRVVFSYHTKLERQETYSWFMKSFDEAGNESERSETFSFIIDK